MYQNYKLCVNPRNETNPNNPDHDQASCCQQSTGAYTSYFARNSCCEKHEGLKPIGECFNDIGRDYEQKIVIRRPEYVYKGDANGKDNSGKGTGNGNKWAQDNSGEGQL